jgi:hypothetical protein
LEEGDGFDRRAEPARIGCATFFVVAILGFPVSLIADFFVGGDLIGRHIGTIYLGMASLLLAAMLVGLALSRRSERDLGLTLWLSDRIVRPGEDLVCTLGVHPVRPIEISAAAIRVTAEESSTSRGVGDVGSTRRVELFQSTVVASPPRTFPADVSEKLIVRVPLPRDAAAPSSRRITASSGKRS